MSGRLLFLLLAACLVAIGLDVGMKRYVFNHISPFHGVSLFQNWFGIDFSLEYVKNTGAAWGFFASWQSYLLWGRILIILALVVYLCLYPFPFARKMALGMIVSGAIGNVLDFFIYGHVVDMFHFRFWGHSFAVFNIADSTIFCGVAALFLESIREKCSQGKCV